MSTQAEEKLDERAALGPKMHIACCEIEEPMTFCGLKPKREKATLYPHGTSTNCVPCVEKDEERKDFCPRHSTCPYGGRR